MTLKRILLMLTLSLSTTVSAYDLNGTMADNGDEDGTYTVALENNDGHEYIGEAEERDDGTFKVTVQDDKGVTFTGTATDSGDNEYRLNLRNVVSGETATGTAEEE